MPLDYTSIIHFFFPPSEDEWLLRNMTKESFAALCTSVHHASTRALLPYNDPHVKAAIHLNKYHYHRKAQTLLTHVLAHYLHTLPTCDTYVVSVPLSGKRLRKRGYNQTDEVVCRAIKTMPHFHNASQILKRTRDTKPQTTLTRKERLGNICNAFTVPARHAHTIQGAHIILVDDVCTTGATLKAATAALQLHSPASVTCIALAH